MIDITKILKELSKDPSLKGLLAEETKDDMLELINQKKMEKSRKNRQEKLKGAKNQSKDELGEEGSPEEDQKPEKIKLDSLPDITPQQIADKIDLIRAGKSLKDKETMAALSQYFQRLNGPERIALYAFVQGLAKVLGGKSGEEVKIPASKPYDVEMDREKKKESSDDSKKSADNTKTSTSSKDQENSSPIVVGERADISSIKKQLWRNG